MMNLPTLIAAGGESGFKIVVDQISMLTIPVIFLFIIGLGMARKAKVYESFVEGGREGFDVFLQILPYIVAIFVAIGLFRVSGALELVTGMFAPLTSKIGMPAEVLPVALMKPLSGSGSLGIAAEIIQQSPDSFKARVASTMLGATDTTFYVLAVYFGAVGIKKVRHALVAGLIADITGLIVAVMICHLVFGAN